MAYGLKACSCHPLILLRNVLLGGELQTDAKNSNFEIFESTLYMKSGSMPWRKGQPFSGVCP